MQIIFNDIVSLQQRINQLIGLIRTYNITTVDIIELNRVKRHENDFNDLKSIADTEISLPIRDFFANSSLTSNYQSAAHKWYSFLEYIYEFFTDFKVQRNVAAYNVANLSHWGELNKPQGLEITENNFDEFARRFPMISGYKPTTLELNDLNEIINVALKSPVQYECNGDTMAIKGKLKQKYRNVLI